MSCNCAANCNIDCTNQCSGGCYAGCFTTCYNECLASGGLLLDSAAQSNSKSCTNSTSGTAYYGGWATDGTADMVSWDSRRMLYAIPR